MCQEFEGIPGGEVFQEGEGFWREDSVFLPTQERETTRVERDGGFHGAGGHGGGHGGGNRQGRRGGAVGGGGGAPSRRQPEPQVFPQENRGGRQSGGVGLALGILNNPADQEGNYNFNFSDDEHGMTREEFGSPGSVSGGYTFISPEGQQVSVEYVADEFGFHPTGSHIPVAPPMPPHVRRLLDHLAKVNGLDHLDG